MSYDDASDYDGLPKPKCRFYGMSNVALNTWGTLVSTGGNQCAVIFDAHAPCKMEMAGMLPDEGCCPLAERYLNHQTTQAAAALIRAGRRAGRRGSCEKGGSARPAKRER